MIIKVIEQRQVDIVTVLAKEIWTEYCMPIIDKDQVECMLGAFQSKGAISAQIHTEGHLYFYMDDFKMDKIVF
jgi:hypothetical protein